MNPEAIIQKIRSVISQELEIDPVSLVDSASLRREYGLDSVAAVNIVFTLERDLALEIDMKQLVSVDSVDDLKVLVTNEFIKKSDDN
jgi:acyl carrier protein